jgi:hypothetical protein
MTVLNISRLDRWLQGEQGSRDRSADESHLIASSAAVQL